MKKILCLLLCALFVTVSFAALAEGNLVAHYDFEDPENLGKDVSGNGNDLEVGGKSVPALTDDAVVGSGALLLDGEGALVTKTKQDFTDELESFTISFYAKHQGYSGEHSRVFSTGYNGCQCGLNMLVAKFSYEGSDHLVYQPIIGDQERDFWGRMDSMTTVLEDIGEYHWYVCAFDADTLTITAWIDGELRGSAEFFGPVVPCEFYGVAIGGSYLVDSDTVMYGFIGAIDDLRIYDYAIADVTEIYGE